MSVGFTTFLKKTADTKFVVKNKAPNNKRIRIFNFPINNGETRDLLSISFVSEADIRHSLLKGELYSKIISDEIEVVFSNIDLLQFDDSQKQFLLESGIQIGLSISGGSSSGDDLKVSINPSNYNIINDTVLSNLEGIDNKIGIIDTNADNINNEIIALTNEITTTNDELGNLINEVSLITDDVSNVKNDIISINEEIDIIKDELESPSNNVDGYITIQKDGYEISSLVNTLNLTSGLNVINENNVISINSAHDYSNKKISGVLDASGNWQTYLDLNIDKPGIYEITITFNWSHSSLTTAQFEARLLKNSLPIGSLPRILNTNFPILQARPTGIAENVQIFHNIITAYVSDPSDFELQFRCSSSTQQSSIWNGHLSAKYINDIDVIDYISPETRLLRLSADKGFFLIGSTIDYWVDVFSGRVVQEDGVGLFGCTYNSTGWSSDIPTLTYTGGGSGFYTPHNTYTSASTSHTVFGVLDLANTSSTFQNLFDSVGFGALMRSGSGTAALGFQDSGGVKSFANNTSQIGKQAIIFVFNGADETVSVYRNGSLLDVSNSYVPTTMGGELGIGNYHNGGFPLSSGSELAELVIWNSALEENDLNLIWDYVSNKY